MRFQLHSWCSYINDTAQGGNAIILCATSNSKIRRHIFEISPWGATTCASCIMSRRSVLSADLKEIWFPSKLNMPKKAGLSKNQIYRTSFNNLRIKHTNTQTNKQDRPQKSTHPAFVTQHLHTYLKEKFIQSTKPNVSTNLCQIPNLSGVTLAIRSVSITKQYFAAVGTTDRPNYTAMRSHQH